MHYQILIVVDDPFLRQRYAETLEAAAALDGAAYQVVTASVVTNAVWYAARRRFDLVIIAEHLRGPLNALTRLLIDRNPEVRVIAVGTQPAMLHCTQHGPDLLAMAQDCIAEGECLTQSVR